MKYLSVCSGIEAASVAWRDLGFTPVAFSEIDKFPCDVLAHHYPNVPNVGDMRLLPEKILSDEVETPDILIGGTPCQSFSVAGLRSSLDDERGNLALIFCEIADAIDKKRSQQGLPPVIAVWENVPGVLSTADNAFGCFLGALSGEGNALESAVGRWTNAGFIIGYKRAIAWRILDAQFFGVAQQRRRVFVVASARDDASPAQILFEPEGLRGDSTKIESEGKNIAGKTPERLGKTSGTGIEPTTFCMQGNLIGRSDQAGPSGLGVSENIAFTITSTDRHAVTVVHGTQDPCVKNDKTFALGRNNGGENVIVAKTLTAHGNRQDPETETFICDEDVRRLTPLENERLQGFPDNYTKIAYRGKGADECADSPRYKAIGNSFAVPVIKWIGERIDLSVRAS